MRWLALLGWIFFAVVFFGPIINLGVGQGNVASDLAAIESLVERHTFYINDATFHTIDQFKFGPHFFSQKSPIFHLAGAAVYWPLHAAGYSLRANLPLCLRALTLVLVILPMGWLLWSLWDHPWARHWPARRRLGFVLAFALGSLATPFAVTLNHYVAAAAALMMAVRALTAAPREGTESGDRHGRRDLRTAGADPDLRRSSQSPFSSADGDSGQEDIRHRSGWRLGLAVGFWVALSLACDVPPAFLFALGVGAAWSVQALRRREGRRFARLAAGAVLGAAPLLLLYAGLNQTILGSPLPPNMHAEEMQYYPGSYWSEIRAQAEAGHPGYYQTSYPRRLWHATLGHKGTYWMMPLLALATAGAVWLAWRRRPGWGLAVAWAAFLPATIALTMIWAFDLSGGAYNIRHCIAAVPPLYGVLAHPGLAAWWRRRGVRRAAEVCAVWGCLVGAVGLLNPWSHNTLSAVPPLENLARLALAHPRTLPTGWIGGLIDATSVKPANGWLDLGLEWMGQGDPAAAAVAFRHSAALDATQTLPYYYLGITLAETRHFGEALAAMQRLVELDPQNLGGWNNFGLIALQAGRPDLARTAYAKSQALAPDNASALYGELLLLDLAGKRDPASPLLRKALRLYPDDARFQNVAKIWGAGTQ